MLGVGCLVTTISRCNRTFWVVYKGEGIRVHSLDRALKSSVQKQDRNCI